jgi:hypothetical protein
MQTAPGHARCSLSHALILRIHGGADHFLVVDGTFVPSFFGLTVGTLAARDAEAVATDGGDRDSDGDSAAVAAASGRGFEIAGEAWGMASGAPFGEGQWGIVPWPLKALLHFLARCAPALHARLLPCSSTSGALRRCPACRRHACW